MSTAKQQRTARFTTVGTISKTRGTGGELLIARPETVAVDRLVGATVFLVPPALEDGPFVVERATDTSEGREKKPSVRTFVSPSSSSSVETPRNVTPNGPSATGTSKRSA